MPPVIETYVIGPIENNTYLFGDPDSQQAVLIDPAPTIGTIISEILSKGWQITAILLTHAHFDHTYGIHELAAALPALPPVLLHIDEEPLYQAGGLGELMGLNHQPLPAISRLLADGDQVAVGASMLEVRHCPGHSLGHVFFYSSDSEAAFVGDIIFRGSYGRTDLPGGDEALLLANIRQKVLKLPPHTRLLSGHGPETTVREELPFHFFLGDH